MWNRCKQINLIHTDIFSIMDIAIGSLYIDLQKV